MYGYGYRYNSGLVVGSGGGGGGFTNTYSLDFDGVDDFVNTGTNDVSISSWIKTTETFVYTLTRCAFGGTDLTFGGNYTLGRLGSGFATPNDTVVRIYNSLGTTKLNDGNWNHIVFTYDYTTKEIKAYTDGSLEVTVVNSLFRSKKIAIGWNGQALHFQGNVDECALWYSVLNASEITDIYNGGTPTDLSLLATPPISWWRNGDGDTYPTITDNGSGGNNGTMTNMDAGDIVTDVPL
jgi:hypothetical protein